MNLQFSIKIKYLKALVADPCLRSQITQDIGARRHQGKGADTAVLLYNTYVSKYLLHLQDLFAIQLKMIKDTQEKVKGPTQHKFCG